MPSTTVTTNVKRHLDDSTFFYCNEELIRLVGTLHAQTHVTLVDNKATLLEFHFNPQNVTGIAPNGETLHATGVTRWTEHIKGAGPYEYTFVNNYRVIGQGQTPNYLVHQVVHVTINANGETTVDFDKNFTVNCNK
ncbi:hypothetical protein [Neobacillus cucumis]|uniref:Uncharacterized protein n=1 Tax=Neobacillus cucumis TaxID=1740721 RepID=A0A2N5HCY5_9BACI|nr:hypothetical protein [Neobacillus cucumis]PLS03381.1 hypothetical protein CVD27_15020 [Neobacillus cucumis]